MRHLALLVIAACAAPSTAATRQPIDLTAAWPAHVIIPGSSTGAHRGADGTHTRKDPFDGKWKTVTSMEEGSTVVIATMVDPSDIWTWSYVDVPISGCGPEDAKWGDFDDDNISDVAVACSGSRKIYVLFGNANGTYTVVLIAASTPGHGRWTQIEAVDMDGDGEADIVAGGYAPDASNAPVDAWFKNPGGGSKRDGTAYAYHLMSLSGQTMSLSADFDWDGDGKRDVFRTDRKGIGSPATWGLWGAGPMHNGATDPVESYTFHDAICAGNGTGPSGGACVGSHGDPMFMTPFDWDLDGHLDIVGGQWSATTNYVWIANGANPAAAAPWPVTYVTSAAVNTNVGHYQGNAVADFRGDGHMSIAITTAKTDLLVDDPTKSGVFIALQLDDGTFTRWEVSGPRGSKFDNVEVVDFGDGCKRLMTSEQSFDSARIGQAAPNGPTGGMGAVLYDNPACAPIVVDGAPDAGVDAAPDACGGVH